MAPYHLLSFNPALQIVEDVNHRTRQSPTPLSKVTIWWPQALPSTLLLDNLTNRRMYTLIAHLQPRCGDLWRGQWDLWNQRAVGDEPESCKVDVATRLVKLWAATVPGWFVARLWRARMGADGI